MISTTTTRTTATTHTRHTRIARPFALAGFVLALLCAPLARGIAQNLDVPYVATPEAGVEEMLRMADAGPGDIHYDLGSGDGRIAIAAVRDFNVERSVGVDIDPQRIEESLHNARAARVTDKVRFVEGDVFEFDFSEATVLTMYLLPWVNDDLRPKVLDLAPGTRVVSHAFDMSDWRPDEHRRVGTSNLYMWIVPAKVAGNWEGGNYTLDLEQQFQNVSGTLETPDGPAVIEDGRLKGTQLRFQASLNGRTIRFDGQVKDDVISAIIDGERLEIERSS